MIERLNEHVLQGWLNHYGYWALVLVLLCENTGVPLPGESVLLLASVLASKGEGFSLPKIILVAIFACVVGDNIGFAIGFRGGRPLLDRYGRVFHITDERIAAAEARFRKQAKGAVFAARFIAGVRVIAGPVAGVLRMPWEQFALFNFLGAVAWVTTISCMGFFGASHLYELRNYVKSSQLAIVCLLFLALLSWVVIHRYKDRKGQRP